MKRIVPKRVASAVLNALRGGVVPRVGLEHIAVGRTSEIEALLHDVSIIEEGGAAFRFVSGRYGSGKSFLLQTMRNHVMERGFAVVDADLAPERRFCGNKGQGLATYKELMQNMSTRSKPDGGALPLILERWISNIQSELAIETGKAAGSTGDANADGKAAGVARNGAMRERVYMAVNSLEGMVNGFEFANAILKYWEFYDAGDDTGKAAVLKWFRGEYATRSEAKQTLGINFIVTDENWYDFIKVFSAFLVKAGYKGLIIIIDELINIYRIPYRIARQYNYEKILAMYNDALQGKAKNLGILMAGTPQAIEDGEKGIYSYDALRSRLSESRFAVEGKKDLFAPVIKLAPLTYEEMYVLIEKLAAIHGDLYEYPPALGSRDYITFLKAEYERVGADTRLMPREIIRDFIEILNIIYQNPGETISGILSEGGFTFAKTETEDGKDDGFADFEV